MITFKDQKSFESWLQDNINHKGIWIKFDKTKKTSKLTAHEALLIALCYGWIDGVIKKIDDQYYQKYFAKRLKKSIWSKKNRSLAEQLITEKRMTSYGLQAINDAKQNHTWKQDSNEPKDFSTEDFELLIKDNKLAYNNYQAMIPSIQKVYALHYFSAKQEKTKQNRLLNIMKRLELNLKPMDKLPKK